MKFKDRKDAAQKLIPKLQKYKKNPQAIILALPRGGIILAYEIAKELKLPLDLIISQKIGAPFLQELAIGAITEDGESFFDENIISSYEVSEKYIEQETKKKIKEATRRVNLYRKNLPPLSLQDKIAILVDDGVATGATMLVTIKSAKARKVKKIIVAVPVIAPDSLRKIEKEVDQVIYLEASQSFGAVGQFYEYFDQIDDKTVIELLKKAHEKA
ncbi:MAG: putative phosphoribosyl transferase [Candidatus Anoxychlamydiales bacterium]|nr:putative phosphoribosyl transferase [Candidatus Anoxychlamydiales bacterium]